MSFIKLGNLMDFDAFFSSDVSDVSSLTSTPSTFRHGRRSPEQLTTQALIRPASSSANVPQVWVTPPSPGPSSSLLTNTPKRLLPEMRILYGKNDIQISLTINGLRFTYDNSGFRHLGYGWVLNPVACSITALDYWRAQMAFLNIPTAGLDIQGMRTVISKLKLDSMDPSVRQGKEEMCEQYQLWQARFLAEDKKVRVPIKYPRIARTENAKFLRTMFFNKQGEDIGESPVLLLYFSHKSQTDVRDYADFLEACKDLELFCDETNRGHVVVGSGLNNLGAKLKKRVDATRAAGFRKKDPEYEVETWWYGETDEEIGKDKEDEDDSSEWEDEEEIESKADWDITGTWSITFPDKDRSVTPRAGVPYTLELFSSSTKTSRETYGRFNFSRIEGFVRFVRPQDESTGNAEEDEDEETEEANGRQARIFPPRDEFDLDISDVPSAKNPTRAYLWRGRRVFNARKGEKKSLDLFTKPGKGKLKFYEGGTKLMGTWKNKEAGLGLVRFDGEKVYYKEDELDKKLGKRGCSIHYEWNNKNQFAYYRGKRGEWHLKGKCK